MKMQDVVARMLIASWLSVPLCAGAATTTQDSPAVATLSVTGQGQISRAPDLATVGVSIVTSDDSAVRALSENNARYAALGAKLGGLGIATADITSTSVESYFAPRPSAGTNAPGQLFGFIVTRNAQINVAALAQTGAVVDAATAAGATQIAGVTYGFRDRRAVERAALAAAVADAYAQAESIARAANLQIVRILRIGDEPTPGRVLPMALSMTRKVEAPVPTTISPGDLEVTSSVSITYLVR